MMRLLKTSSMMLVIGLLTTIVTTGQSAQTHDAVGVLLSKARSLEARGRMDLAAQNWQQVLLVEPNQREALAGLARRAKQSGDQQALRKYLDRLRAINPRDPAIAAIERLRPLSAQDQKRLDDAGKLMMQDKADEAMKIYHEIFGEEPAPGKWAERYYEAAAASTGGREKAIAQLRQLAKREPDNELYRLWLARTLTYDPKTRLEGIRLLESIRDAGAAEQARSAWRQALVWDKANAAYGASLEAYLRKYPDQELQKALADLREGQQRAAQAATEQHGFQALRNKDLRRAGENFEAVLRRAPSDPEATAGLGFVRLNEQRFEDAIALFERARKLAPGRTDVREGYDTARFWSAMNRAAARRQSDPVAASAAYRNALAIRPDDEQALTGLAQSLLEQQQWSEAEATFTQVLHRSPDHADALAGLATIRLNEKKFKEATEMFARARTLHPNQPGLENGYRAAKFWGLMVEGATALDQNRPDPAIRSYQEAVELTPESKQGWFGLAGAFVRKQDHIHAAQAYIKIIGLDPGELPAWMGLIKSQSEAKDAKAVLLTAQRVPSNVRPSLEARSEYLSLVALASYRADQPTQGDNLLRRAVEIADADDTDEALGARLEVARALVEQGLPDRAAWVYTQVTKAHPTNAVAWQGLIGAYIQMRDASQSLAALRSMPQAAFDAAAKKPGFLNAMATIYAGDGRCVDAEHLLSRSLELDKAAGRSPAENTRLQLADIWMRQGRFDRARQGYQEATAANANSADAWRGYLIALHNEGDDQRAVTELHRIPPAVYGQLTTEPEFVTVLAGAHAAVGRQEQAIEFLEQARSQYQARGAVTPVDTEIQLAWTVLESPSRQASLGTLLGELRSRGDLTDEQRATAAEIWLTWRLRSAEEALRRQQSDQALAILTDAGREYPGDRRIRGGLAAIYMQQHQYDRALAIYQTWGMAEADAAEYRTAAGAALAVRDEIVADRFLRDGLRKWPNDPELLRMTARRAATQGEYRQAEEYLKSALTAVRQGRPAIVQETAAKKDPPVSISSKPSAVPACRDAAGTAAASQETRFRLIAAAWIHDQTDVHRHNGPPTVPGSSLALKRAQDPASSAQPQRDVQEQPQRDVQETEAIQDELDVVQHRNSPFVVGSGLVTDRAGDPGIDRLVVRDGVAGGSVTIANRVRLRVEAHGVLLSSGASDGRSQRRFGTLREGAAAAEQKASGTAGEVQLSTTMFGLAVGTSPRGFLTDSTVTGGLRLGPLGGPVTLMVVRENVKDSLLSYAGSLDPGTGRIWGGVISNSATLQFSRDRAGTGQYLSVQYAALRGENVADNWSGEGNAGAYFRILSRGDGGLSAGVNMFGMHYERNLAFFSLGQGGYFSPQQYYLASVPVSWRAREGRVEYEIAASGGAQHFSTERSPYFPTLPLNQQLYYSGESRTGANYNLSLRMNVRLTPYWQLGAFATANNTRNYNARAIGVTLRVLGQRLPTGTNLRVQSVPEWRGNQPFSY